MIFDFISGEASTQEGGEKFAKWLAEDTDLTQKEKKSVIEKIKDFFTKLLDAVRSVIEGQGTLNTTARAGQKAAQQVPVLDDFFNALDNAIDNRQRMLDGEQRNTTDDKSSTGIRFSKDLDQYPYDMQTVIKEYLAAVDNKILKFIQDFKSGTYEEKVGRLQFGEVSDRQAADIKRLLGIDIQGFKNSINTNALRHIEKRHGVNGEQDHSMKNVNDLARVGYILENYDDVDILREQNGNPVYSSEFKNKDGSYAPMVGFFKKINGTYYVAESIVDSKWKKAWVTSVYINKNRHGYLSTNMAVTPHQFTPETPLRSPVSANTKVTQNGPDVNTHSMQKGQKNAQNGGSNTHHSLEVDRQGNALSEAQQVPVLDDFFNALDNAIGNRQRMLDGDTAQKNSTGEKTGADVRFSIDPEFKKKYDQWDGSDPRVTFFLGTTGRALKNAGMVNQKIYFDASKILKIKNKHPEITDSVIKQIPSVLQNPIIIMKSKDPKNKPRNFKGYTIFGELYVRNNPVLVVLGADMYGRNGMKLDGVKVVSAYRRNNAQPFMDSSDVVFVTKNKERISMWEGRTGLRLPVGDSSTNPLGTTIPQNGFGVNTHSMQNGQKNAQNGGSNTQHSLETDSPDIRYSKRVGFDNALTGAEKKKYNRALQTGEDAGLRISDSSILVECENNSKYQYKYVVYDDMEDGPVVRDVYAIGRIDPNVEDDVASQCHEIARFLSRLEDIKYDNWKHVRTILSDSIKNTSYVLTRYNPKTHRFYVVGRGSVENGTNTLYKSNRGRASGEDTRIAGDRTDRNRTDRRRSRDIDDTGRTSLLRDDKRLDEMNITLRQVFDSQELETGHHTSQTQVQRVARQLKKSTRIFRYSKRVGFDKALTPAEKKKYNRAMQTGEDAGLRISDNSILVECENNSKYQYKYVVYDDMEDGPVIRDVYVIGRIDPNVEDDVASQCYEIARFLNELEDVGYDNRKHV